MDTSDPDIVFNETGCNHCLSYDIAEAERQQEKPNLPSVLSQITASGGEYDCLLGLSGGVDSSLCLHYLIQAGVKPLCFSVDNGWNTPEADENIMRLVEGLKVPFYRYTIDLERFRELQQAFIASGTPNIEIPTDHILSAASYDLAKRYKITWIISGGNLATESVMPPAWGYNARDLRFIKSVYAAYTGGRPLRGLPLLSLWGYLKCRFWYGIKIVNLLDYYEYNREEAKQLLKEKYGWKDYGEKHTESVFTDWFQRCYLPFFGIVKERAHLSSLILSKQISREEALNQLSNKIPTTAEKFVVGLNGLGTFAIRQKRSHRDFKNSEWLWTLLSKVYRSWKS